MPTPPTPTHQTAPASWAWHALVVAVHVAGSLNNLFYGLSNIVIERDWVGVIGQEDDAWLRAITANLKSIDLSCDLVAPMVVSFLQFFSYGALAAAIWWVVPWALLPWLLCRHLHIHVYPHTSLTLHIPPSLQHPTQ